jgi:hypothetical protein
VPPVLLYRVVLSFYFFFCTRVGLLPPGANPIAVKIIILKNIPEDRTLLNVVFANISDISVGIAECYTVVPDSCHPPAVIDVNIFVACT